MILMESGGGKSRFKGLQVTAQLLEEVLALGEFELIASYDATSISSSRSVAVIGRQFFQERTLNLYKRREPMEFNQLAAPPITTMRSKFKVEFH